MAGSGNDQVHWLGREFLSASASDAHKVMSDMQLEPELTATVAGTAHGLCRPLKVKLTFRAQKSDNRKDSPTKTSLPRRKQNEAFECLAGSQF